MRRFSNAAATLLVAVLVVVAGCARTGPKSGDATSGRPPQGYASSPDLVERQKKEGDAGARFSRRVPGKDELPDDAPVPLNLGMTGAKVPPPDELARQARQLREENRKRGIQGPLTRSADALPPTFESPYVTKPARLQSNNDCWAFATIEVMESAFLKAAQSTEFSLHFAPQAVVDCNPYGYTAEAGGWWSFIVYEDGFSGRHGGPLAVNYPYAGHTQACKPFICPCYVDTARELIGDGGYADAAQVKAAIMDKGAVGTAIFADGKFLRWYNTDAVFTSRPNFQPGCPDPRNCPWHNHVVVITGWDDARQAWHVRNSWGTDWGRDGYAWVRYGENAIGYAAAWAEMAPKPRDR